jgi:hypothetical protein
MISCFDAKFEVRCVSHKGYSFIEDFNLSLPTFTTDKYVVSCAESMSSNHLESPIEGKNLE